MKISSLKGMLGENLKELRDMSLASQYNETVNSKRERKKKKYI